MRFVVVAILSLICPAAVLAADEMARPPIETAGSDERGRIAVNGTPCFPILMYDVPVDAESLAMFRDHGFNTLSARVEDAELLRRQGFYTAAHAAGTEGANLAGVLFGVGMDSPALYWKDDLLEKSKADLAKLRELFPRRPIFHAIGYWENEPEGVFSNQLPTKDRYEDLVGVLDVAAPYLYPIPYQPVSSVGDAVRRADAASGGKKPVLPVLQLFAWKPDDRYPTPDELKCMAYLSLIHGADGIGYYSYNHVTGKTGTNIAREQPELWRVVKDINAEIRQIGEFLLEARPEPAVAVTADKSAVAWRAVSRGDSVLLLVSNTTTESQPVKVTWPAKTAGLRRIGRDSTLPVTAGAAEFVLAPHAAWGLQSEN